MSRVLVVEDYANIQSIYQSSLSHEGHTVDVASDGNEALDRIATNHYDAIMLDLLMPNMDGLEFLRQAKLNETSPGTIVVVLSNVADPDTLKEATELGVAKYLVKAKYKPSDVVKEVQQLLKPEPQ